MVSMSTLICFSFSFFFNAKKTCFLNKGLSMCLQRLLVNLLVTMQILHFHVRYAEEFFGGVYGDIILIVYGFPFVLIYVIMALGKPNLTEHGVGVTL